MYIQETEFPNSRNRIHLQVTTPGVLGGRRAVLASRRQGSDQRPTGIGSPCSLDLGSLPRAGSGRSLAGSLPRAGQQGSLPRGAGRAAGAGRRRGEEGGRRRAWTRGGGRTAEEAEMAAAAAAGEAVRGPERRTSGREIRSGGRSCGEPEMDAHRNPHGRPHGDSWALTWAGGPAVAEGESRSMEAGRAEGGSGRAICIDYGDSGRRGDGDGQCLGPFGSSGTGSWYPNCPDLTSGFLI
jgi:hypothetical protein